MVYTLIMYTLTEYIFRFSKFKKIFCLLFVLRCSSPFSNFLSSNPLLLYPAFTILLILLYLGQMTLLVTLYTLLCYLCVSLGSNSRILGTSLVCYHWATLIDRILQWIFFYICYISQTYNCNAYMRHYSILIYCII